MSLIPSSNKILTSNANSKPISLQAIATILPNQVIDVRWNRFRKIVMGNGTLTLIKVHKLKIIIIDTYKRFRLDENNEHKKISLAFITFIYPSSNICN
jgi:hypothetical protein